MQRSRDFRRKHDHLVKRRVRGHANAILRTHDPRAMGRLAATRTPCSCPMCGNPRHHGGALTRQELRAAENLEIE